MDTSIKRKLDQIYGQYTVVVDGQGLREHDRLFSRRYFWRLRTRSFADLIKAEFSNGTLFALVTEGKDKRVVIEGAYCLVQNTPVYLCVPYHFHNSSNTVWAKTSYADCDYMWVYDRQTIQYLLVYPKSEEVSVALLELVLDINAEGVVTKTARVSVPTEAEYYETLLNKGVWTGIRDQMLKLHINLIKEFSKELSDIQTARSDFAFLSGRVDEQLSLNGSLPLSS